MSSEASVLHEATVDLPVTVEIDGRIARATIDRPETLNAINQEVVDGLNHALDLAVGREARVLLISGRGGTLSSGADLPFVKMAISDPDQLESFVAAIAEVVNRLETEPIAVVCSIDGYAVAGGCELLLGCDVVVASEDSKIGDRHVAHALLPGAGGGVRLGRYITPARARWLMLSGSMLSGAEAADWGLVTFAVPAAELATTVEVICSQLATIDGDTIARVKQIGIETRDLPVEEAVLRERQIFVEHLTESPQVKERLDGFIERKKS